MFLNKGERSPFPLPLRRPRRPPHFFTQRQSRTPPSEASRARSFPPKKRGGKSCRASGRKRETGGPPCAVLKTTLREVLEYCPQSTRVLAARYAADSCMPRHAEEEDTQKKPGSRPARFPAAFARQPECAPAGARSSKNILRAKAPRPPRQPAATAQRTRRLVAESGKTTMGLNVLASSKSIKA